MSNSVDVESAVDVTSKTMAEPAAPLATTNSESQTSESKVVSSIVERWRREDLLKKANSVLRATALVFALISLIIVASNKHGDWMDFDQYVEYRYLLVISILAFLYTGGQIIREVQLLLTGKDVISPRSSVFLDFFGDQIAAYLLISALSVAASLTNRMRVASDNLFTDASAAAVSMAFFAFGCLALSALVSGFKLSNQTYV
ncbi:CASP-like protein 4B4 [Aristolochia californica]|uniref:CASP-like protein 4B4 n=1 Tax=Aristolochia californica TaxID=171875 RepID=UPI0035D54759